MKKKIYNLCLYLTAVLIMISGILQKSTEWTLVGCTCLIADVIQNKEISVHTHVRADTVNVIVKDEAAKKEENK